ncbi:DUF421 domain-containing protein [Agrilactobacillus fermenti]|uniref:DUF421 domain-containing protein n=1 Tax=Agrilactobacillus fermenti TaxID=2586909 RepID=UPI003A5C61F9
MFDYMDLTIKLILGFFALILQINLAGKGNLAPTNAVDQLQNYVLGGIVGGMLYNPDITILQFFSVLLIWTLIVFITKFLTNHFAPIKKIIDGEPTTVIYNGKILVEQAAQRGITAYDLSFKLRNAGISDIHSVKRAILEQNGQLTVTQVGDDAYHYPVILDGHIDHDALELINKDEPWLNAQIAKQKYDLEDIYMAIWLNQTLLVYAYGHGSAKH